MKIKLSKDVGLGLGPGHTVSDRDPVPPPKEGGSAPPNCRQMSVVVKRLDVSRCHLVYGGRPRPRRYCVTLGPAPPQKMGTAAPTFRPMYCAHMAGWIKMSLGAEIGLGSGHVVLDKDPAPLPKRGWGTTDPQFSAHVCCGQTAGWIKMPLDTEVVLGPGHIVLDGDPASSFRSMSIVAKRSPISATAEHLSV